MGAKLPADPRWEELPLPIMCPADSCRTEHEGQYLLRSCWADMAGNHSVQCVVAPGRNSIGLCKDHYEQYREEGNA